MNLVLLPLLLLASAADQKSNDKLPPANPLPMPVSEESQVMVPLNAWFAAIDAADANAIRAQLRMDGGGGATVAATKADGSKIVRHMTWEQYLANVKPGEHRYHEQFTGRPAIEIDGDIAMVWGEFTLSVDGKVATCGVDHFDLIRENGQWKVQNVTWSQRTTECPEA
ncbi:nuclear transport factor 2 family protein [Sphingomonas sp.]|uniref:nuclear transport factor 2 family protein n=1 Tax=Sphingomonas sp. TaxID=28214 RepID=UPI0025F740F3|nr:nuclear transport factor 2 family protein [Sphingomonas sp.]